MQIRNNKKIAVTIAILLTISMLASMTLSPLALAQVYPPKGTHIPSYSFINVAPNPVGIGQTVNVNFFLSAPLPSVEDAKNMTVVETTPAGTSKTLGPYTSDLTGGTFFNFVPDTIGNYTFKLIYGGQTLSGTGPFSGLISDPSQSQVETLVVQQQPIIHTAYPFTPLPTSYWQTPVSAENVQNWYPLTGPWLGYGAVTFATTGGYNVSCNYNPYTLSVKSGHVLWTKPWAAGGVVGGDLGGNEQDSSYWSTSQYEPKYAPVVMNGIMYSTWYTTSTAYSNGIAAVNLYNGQTMWVINTTNALRCGMNVNEKTINQYGVVGPYIWTTGTLPPSDTGGTLIAEQAFATQWNMYDALTGKYVLSVANGSALTLRTDAIGDMIGYFINNTAGTEVTHPVPGTNVLVKNTAPHLTMVNMTMAIGQGTNQQWTPRVNSVYSMSTGYMWSVQVPNNISGVPLSPALALNSITGNAVIMTAGFSNGQGVGGDQEGWLVVATMDQDSGQVLMLSNITYSQTAALLPWTRTTEVYGEGLIVIANDVSYDTVAYNVRTGTKVWEQTLTGENGAAPNAYDLFSLKPYFGPGVILWEGLGGDLWCQSATNGKILWYTNTTTLIGPSGIETPYNVWPLWVFTSSCVSNDIAYLAIGHEYNPPLFHGAQLLAINITNGNLVWSELDTSVTSTEISYGIVLSLNAYDNQVYAFGQGPTATTISAPNIGVTTATPITITGTVIDVSAGTKQQAVAANFPNGVPAVSDASMSIFMAAVYQQQPMPHDITGVPVTFSVIDSNGNYRTIGSTTTNGLGDYSFTWKPDIPGNYTVYATFAGTQSYYGSTASTGFYASTPAATPAPTATPLSGVATQTTLEYIGIAIIIVIIIIGAVLALLVTRKRP
ncbi:MAG: PQQ-binding-like beta-propeller repeat protein [Candidatus Bathyarchaeia archaeon]|jgi:hypothetical protein